LRFPHFQGDGLTAGVTVRYGLTAAVDAGMGDVIGVEVGD
jgi:hypothetical protein